MFISKIICFAILIEMAPICEALQYLQSPVSQWISRSPREPMQSYSNSAKGRDAAKVAVSEEALRDGQLPLQLWALGTFSFLSQLILDYCHQIIVKHASYIFKFYVCLKILSLSQV